MITFPVYLVSRKGVEMPLLLKSASWPVSLPLFSSVESAGVFVVQSDFAEDGEIWRVPNATSLKRWLERVADHCECVPWDLCNHGGEWRTSSVLAFDEFLTTLSRRVASEQFAPEN